MWILFVIIPILILLGGWIFLIAPGKKYGVEKYEGVRFAHRGLHGTVGSSTFAAENSLTAFARAVEHGFGIELDVHVSCDGEVVVFHDDTLDRVTGASGKISETPIATLKSLSLSGTSDTIPTLREVLELVNGKVPLLIELKETGFDHTISEKTAEILKDYKGEFIVESFSPLAFCAIRNTLGNVPCGFLSDKLTEKKEYRSIKYRLIQRFILNVVARPSFIAMNLKRSRMFPLPIIKKLFATPTFAWTVRSEDEEREAYERGFSGIIFENYMPENVENGGKI